jgi:hypothetical protein
MRTNALTVSAEFSAKRVWLLGFLMLSVSQAWGDVECDSKMREAVRAAVRGDGAKRVITIRREDQHEFPVYAPAVQRLVFYEITEGGLDTDESGRVSLSIVDHPATWRVFVDRDSNRVYRVFGFSSGTEFSVLAKSLMIKLSAEKARLLAEGFVELAYATRATVVRNGVEARRFVEGELYSALRPADLDGFMTTWLKRSGKTLTSVNAPSVHATDDGFDVTLTVAKGAGETEYQPKAEIRLMQIHIAPDSSLSVTSDRLLVTAEAPGLDE